jgi:hypothetical protein
MILYEQGLPYWTVAKRYHAHRHTSKAIGPTAVRDMIRLQQQTRSPAVQRRIGSFIAAHQSPPPGMFPNGSGPRVA